jgi:tRNA(adenine34) deaminase
MHERFMEIALEEAARARRAGEVPLGAVVVLSDVVVGRGHNSVLASSDPSAHAEVLAMRDAAARLRNYRLIGATLYCTVEPCLMCLGTAMHARISRVVYGAPDLKVGAIGRLTALRAAGADFNHRFESVGGVLADRAAALLLDFFREKRAATRMQEAATAMEKRGEVPKWS